MASLVTKSTKWV